MIEILILYELSKKISTMYGIAKEIRTNFSVFLTPSIGTIKPALIRLEKSGCLKTQKAMSKGGRPSTFYSITDNGMEKLKELLLNPPQNNPIHFLTTARIKLLCSNVLSDTELSEMVQTLRKSADNLLSETYNTLKKKMNDFYPEIIFDNLACEYKNFISLLEGVQRAGKH